MTENAQMTTQRTRCDSIWSARSHTGLSKCAHSKDLEECSTMCHIQRLPDELLDQIFAAVADFDRPAPSTINFWKEPGTDLARSEDRPIKNLSLVCQRWRRIVLPSLFKHACVNLDPRASWIRLCGNLERYIWNRGGVTPEVRALIHRIHEAQAALPESTSHAERDPDRTLALEYHADDVLGEYNFTNKYLYWVPSARGEVEEFICFMTKYGLLQGVKSLVVYANNDIAGNRSNLEETTILREIQDLWKTIFRAMPLETITVAAPPSTMAMLAGCNDAQWEAWLFNIPYFYITFSITSPYPICKDYPKSKSDIEAPSPPRTPSPGRPLFLYNARQWQHLGYNEGSSLRAYRHYEYQWMRPSQILPILFDWLVRESLRPTSPSIKSVDYISIFPYITHVAKISERIRFLPDLKAITVKLAEPDFVDNKERMGKAMPQDVYAEWEKCYLGLGRMLRRMGRGVVFRSRDMQLGEALGRTVREQMLMPDFRPNGLVPVIRLFEEDGDAYWRRVT